MLKVILISKGTHFEFICVTMPGLEPPLEESGYKPESSPYSIPVIKDTHVRGSAVVQ